MNKNTYPTKRITILISSSVAHSASLLSGYEQTSFSKICEKALEAYMDNGRIDQAMKILQQRPVKDVNGAQMETT